MRPEPMKKSVVLRFFESRAACEDMRDAKGRPIFEAGECAATRVAALLGISRQGVHQWPDRVPELSARKLHERTHGALKFNPSAYR